MSNPTQPTLTDPQLIDAAVDSINAKLLTALSWLDNAYGKAQRLIRERDGKRYYYPAVYVSGATDRDYLTMFPDSAKGNFCFFDFKDGEKFDEWYPGEYQFFTADFGLVFWFDIENIYTADYGTKTIENVKREVLDALAAISVPGGKIRIESIYERAENIFPGYDHNEIENLFLMRPYMGFRINGQLRVKVSCT